MKQVKIATVVLATSLAVGCATGLDPNQEKEYMAMQSANMLVEEKNPSTGAWLGVLPGGGSFYVRRPGLGMINLLFWPLSIFWDPISGYDGSQVINYNMTKYKLKRDKEKEMLELDEKRMAGKLDANAYSLEKKKIDQKFDFN
jgi:hypothetical protein